MCQFTFRLIPFTFLRTTFPHLLITPSSGCPSQCLHRPLSTAGAEWCRVPPGGHVWTGQGGAPAVQGCGKLGIDRSLRCDFVKA